MVKRIVISQSNKALNPLLQSIENKRKFCQKINRKNILIESKRSTKLDIFGPCSLCGLKINPLWKFSKSSVGKIYLCQKCKEKRNKEGNNVKLSRRELKEKLSEDFFKNKVVLVGSIESNRRKH